MHTLRVGVQDSHTSILKADDASSNRLRSIRRRRYRLRRVAASCIQVANPGAAIGVLEAYSFRGLARCETIDLTTKVLQRPGKRADVVPDVLELHAQGPDLVHQQQLHLCVVVFLAHGVKGLWLPVFNFGREEVLTVLKHGARHEELAVGVQVSPDLFHLELHHAHDLPEPVQPQMLCKDQVLDFHLAESLLRLCLRLDAHTGCRLETDVHAGHVLRPPHPRDVVQRRIPRQVRQRRERR
mmetsp:Transcript_2075/g.7102  ORF Transcript_2075/g.7102 Transcript_2075/m.7102 type:complete len:240 (-) Transcript_2075:436-1155(-)